LERGGKNWGCPRFWAGDEQAHCRWDHYGMGVISPLTKMRRGEAGRGANVKNRMGRGKGRGCISGISNRPKKVSWCFVEDLLLGGTNHGGITCRGGGGACGRHFVETGNDYWGLGTGGAVGEVGFVEHKKRNHKYRKGLGVLETTNTPSQTAERGGKKVQCLGSVVI